MTLTELSIKRPSFVVVVFAVLTLLGLISYNQLGYELLPKFNVPTLTVTAVYPGAAPTEIESQVTKRIEDAVSALEGIKRIRSTSLENLSVVIIELQSTVDVDAALSDAQRKISRIAATLPTNSFPFPSNPTTVSY